MPKGRWLKYNNRKTYLPKASTVGFGKYHAKAGDFIKFELVRDNGDTQAYLARVIGQIAETDNDGPSGKGMLLVSMLGSTYAFAHEMWVDPKDVTLCEAPERAREFLAWFMNATPEELHTYNRKE